MPQYKVTIGIGVVQDQSGRTRPVVVDGQAQPQVEIVITLEATDATAAFDHVQARLQELLAAPQR